MWSCPKCLRDFQKKNQWHSCGTMTSLDYLEGKQDDMAKVYKLLEEGLRKSGVRIDAAKTAISLWKVRNFATVYVQKRGIKVEFLSRTPIGDKRIASQHKVKEGLYFSRLKLLRMEDVDDKLLTWLKGID